MSTNFTGEEANDFFLLTVKERTLIRGSSSSRISWTISSEIFCDAMSKGRQMSSRHWILKVSRKEVELVRDYSSTRGRVDTRQRGDPKRHRYHTTQSQVSLPQQSPSLSHRMNIQHERTVTAVVAPMSTTLRIGTLLARARGSLSSWHHVIGIKSIVVSLWGDRCPVPSPLTRRKAHLMLPNCAVGQEQAHTLLKSHSNPAHQSGRKCKKKTDPKQMHSYCPNNLFQDNRVKAHSLELCQWDVIMVWNSRWSLNMPMLIFNL